MRVHLRYCSAAVRDEIVAGQTPLGRILIQHNVLRRIEPTGYLRVLPRPAMMKWFGFPHAQPTYGRLAIIHCDEMPAVELLEMVFGARRGRRSLGDPRVGSDSRIIPCEKAGCFPSGGQAAIWPGPVAGGDRGRHRVSVRHV